MRVAFFIGGLNRGGTETLLLDVFAKRENAPFEMVLVYRNEGNLSDEFRATGVPMFRLKPQGGKMKYFLELRKLLKSEKVDILHAQTPTNALIGIVCTLFIKTKLVFTFHGLFSSSNMWFKRHVAMWFSKEVVFVSKYVKDWYSSNSIFFPKKRSNVVYNGINFDKINAVYTEPDFFKDYESDKSVRLAMVGNFMSGRSHIVVCRSLKLLYDKGVRNFHFYFVGKRVEAEAKLFDACVNYCEANKLTECVHFIGSRGDVPAILQHIDGFVYSTVDDTFGIAVVEAVSAGLPVVVNDWVVMREIFENQSLVEFFETGNIEDCCDKIQMLIEDIENRKKEAAGKANIIKEKYSIEKHICSLNNVYNKVVS